MYRCCECGHLFDEPVEFADREEYWGAPCYNKYYLSPCCHEDFDEVTDDDEEYEESEEIA